jgi:hypothetical protein
MLQQLVSHSHHIRQRYCRDIRSFGVFWRFSNWTFHQSCERNAVFRTFTNAICALHFPQTSGCEPNQAAFPITECSITWQDKYHSVCSTHSQYLDRLDLLWKNMRFDHFVSSDRALENETNGNYNRIVHTRQDANIRDRKECNSNLLERKQWKSPKRWPMPRDGLVKTENTRFKNPWDSSKR